MPPPSVTAKARFPIVGIGASAGGLEAFEQFLSHAPPDIGMAFVLVSHLDPGRASLLTEILQRTTAMQVVEVQDKMKVVPDTVYVIPPNRDMAIFQGALQLSLPEEPRGHRMPIDAFLQSLADDQGERAVGIILSGTGTDGTEGLRAILEAGGICLVQEPAMAKFDGMPTSAIHAGYANAVLPAEEMPRALQGGISTQRIRPERPSPPEVGDISPILMQLRSATGNDFSQYKRSTIGRRIERRMLQHEITDIGVYGRYLREYPSEMQALFRELLINVTTFFRDPDAFVVLKRDILPQLWADKPEGSVFRAWVAGCASGEEAYSLAIVLREFMLETRQNFKVQLYATDLDDEAIATARAGVYPALIAQDVTPERLHRFFIKEESGYRVKKEIREMIVFATHNVIKDPPFTRLDLLSCRNLMIYLESELQNRLIPVFHYALKPAGILLLSPSESIGHHNELFTPQDRKWKFYRALHTQASTRSMMSAGVSWSEAGCGKANEVVMKKPKEPNFAELARRALLQTYAPASVVTDLKGNILYVHGDTGRYLRPAPGQPTLNVFDMAREGLGPELRAAVQAVDQGAPILNRAVAVKGNDTDTVQSVSLSVRQMIAPEGGEGLRLVSFQEAAPESGETAPPKRRRSKRTAGPEELHRIEDLERELAYTRENLHATIEEQQASNEDLKVINEEIQSTNEELQATNEELETSKEELQSVNEELITVNAELQAKIEQLATMQNDMKNLLDNISVGTVFLDDALIIRRFTREAARVYRMVPSDVGRSLNDIKSDIEGDDLLAHARTVLNTLLPCEREVRTFDGTWYLVRIQPYYTLDDVRDGVVLTFTDISKRVAAEAETRAARELAEAIVDAMREPLLVLDDELRVVSASRSFYSRFQVAPEATLGRSIYELGNHQWDIPALRELLENILPHNQGFYDYVVDHDFPVIGRRHMLLNARRIVTATGATRLILLAMEETR